MPEKSSTKRARMVWPKTQILVLGCLILISLLALVGFGLYIQRQLVAQRQSALARAEYTSVHYFAQLAREHLRLYALIQAAPADFALDLFTQQRDLVDSRVEILLNLYQGAYQPEQGPPQLAAHMQAWAALQAPLDQWQLDPTNEVMRRQLLAQLAELELQINAMMRNRQHSFEDGVADWIASSAMLANLILGGSVIFGALVLLTTYSVLHFLAEQRRSEDALRASEQRHRAILETIPDAVFRIRRDGVVRDYKPSLSLMAHPADTTCLGQSIAAVLPSAVAELYQESLTQTLQTREPQVIEYQLTNSATQELRNFEARAISSGRDEVQVIVRDITEEKMAERRLQQAQKLESLGVMAGGIAHDFNNLLTGMLGQASLAKFKLAQGLPAEEQINKTITAAERAADLTRQLLAYAGKGVFQVGPLDLNQLIRENVNLLQTALPNHTDLQLDLASNLPLMEADRGQIQQLVMNLVINAAEAGQAGRGYVGISTQTVVAESIQELARYTGSELAPGSYIGLQVRDNGVGMDAQTLSRIFDPFFSTKAHGHGLGLSATLGIIRTHRAGIQVQSQLGQGTTVALLFPILPQQPTILTPASEPAFVKKVDMPSILVIDDEPYVRQAVVDILETEGLSVFVASSGAEGLNCFRQQQAKIGVILLDMKMPGMNGEETYRELRQINDQVKVILSSGFNESDVNRSWRELGIYAFLQKPYNIDMLLQSVYGALDAQDYDKSTYG